MIRNQLTERQRAERSKGNRMLKEILRVVIGLAVIGLFISVVALPCVISYFVCGDAGWGVVFWGSAFVLSMIGVIAYLIGDEFFESH